MDTNLYDQDTGDGWMLVIKKSMDSPRTTTKNAATYWLSEGLGLPGVINMQQSSKKTTTSDRNRTV